MGYLFYVAAGAIWGVLLALARVSQISGCYGLLVYAVTVVLSITSAVVIFGGAPKDVSWVIGALELFFVSLIVQILMSNILNRR